MTIIETLEPMLVQGLKNGMSLNQVRDRLPTLCARQLGISTVDFHARLEQEAGAFDVALEQLTQRITSQFSAAEQRAIVAR